ASGAGTTGDTAATGDTGASGTGCSWGIASCPITSCAAPAVASPAIGASEVGYRWQATRTPSANVTSGGTTSVQTGIANAHRGAKRQPGGGVGRAGGIPGIPSSVRRSAWMFGKAASSACVYG